MCANPFFLAVPIHTHSYLCGENGRHSRFGSFAIKNRMFNGKSAWSTLNVKCIPVFFVQTEKVFGDKTHHSISDNNKCWLFLSLASTNKITDTKTLLHCVDPLFYFSAAFHFYTDNTKRISHFIYFNPSSNPIRLKKGNPIQFWWFFFRPCSQQYNSGYGFVITVLIHLNRLVRGDTFP